MLDFFNENKRLNNSAVLSLQKPAKRDILMKVLLLFIMHIYGIRKNNLQIFFLFMNAVNDTQLAENYESRHSTIFVMVLCGF